MANSISQSIKNILIATAVMLSLCACKPISSGGVPADSSIILRVEYREISKDLIREFRFMDSGLVEETINYISPEQASKLFKTKFYRINSPELDKLKKQISELQKLQYQNQFPWKEDFYQRGNVIKYEFAGSDGLAHSYYYYTGHENSPQILKDLSQLLLR